MSAQAQENENYVVDNQLKDNIENYKLSKSFSCGQPALDNYFFSKLKRALKSENVGALGVVNEQGELFGFCTYTFEFLVRKAVAAVAPQSNQPREVPAVKLSVLAVDGKYQGLGIGTELLMHTLENTLRVHEIIPVKGLYLDAVESAEAFYAKLGFKKLDNPSAPAGCIPMFLPIKVIANAVSLS
ncbi:GNAT family N-acetyltransferase [Pseudomonas phoenicis]|uniref:GNAT family N-acetyltransferase n=1 Tax=unclassified Pseudomonas TaxID=196821 RepID=UPI0039A321A1